MNQNHNNTPENISQRDLDIATHEMLHFFQIETNHQREQEVMEFAHFEGAVHFNAFRALYHSLPKNLRYDIWEHLNEFGLPHELIAP